MAMKLNKEQIVPVLLKNKAHKVTENLYSMMCGDIKCIIDFRENEFYYALPGDDARRKYETDAPDEVTQFKVMCLRAMFPNAADQVDRYMAESGELSESAPEQPGQGDEGEQEESTNDENIPEINEPIAKITSKPITRIKGITPQLCECGKIKIGRKGQMTTSQKGRQFRPPEKLDHFIVTTMQKSGQDDFVEDHVIMSKLGDNCTAIPVMLLYDDPDLNFPTSYAYYDNAQCQCRGNGEIAITADGRQIPCDPETCSNAAKKLCKPNGVLSVVLQDAPRVGGVWKFRTTGWNSIRNLMSSIEFIHGLTGGRLAGLPLILTLQPKTTVIPGTKTTTTIYMVNIEFRGSMGELLNRAATRLATPEQVKQIEARAAEMLSLPESPEECKDVQEEFYPETVVTA